MKSNFTPDVKIYDASKPNLAVIKNRIENKDSYVIVNLSTTGIGVESRPIGLYMALYEYNHKTLDYTPTLTFDKLVDCGKEALGAALKNTDYDVFTNSGIDKDAYIKGENVLSVEDFKKEFFGFLTNFDKNEIFIGNASDFITNNLAKIGCGEPFAYKISDKTMINYIGIAKELFSDYDMKKNGALTLTKQLEQSGLLDNLDIPLSEDKSVVIGSNNRVAAINALIMKYAADNKYIKSDKWRNAYKTLSEEKEKFSEEGKERYAKSGFDDKFEILKKNNALSPEAIFDRESDCHLNRLLNLLENDKKGFVVMQVATTGFNAGDEPIEISALPFVFTDNGIEFKNDDSVTFLIEAGKRNVNKALNDKSFDAFAYAGIDKEKYLAGEGVFSREEAITKINDFFKKYPYEEYSLVSNGQCKSNKTISYSQGALNNLGNLSICKAPFIDFTQFVKEYSYYCYETGEKNAIVNDDFKGNFSLENLAKYHGMENEVKDTLGKCVFVYQLLEKVAVEEDYVKEATEKTTVAKIDIDTVLNEDIETNTRENIIEENDIELFNEDTVSVEENAPTETKKPTISVVKVKKSSIDKIESDIIGKPNEKVTEIQQQKIPEQPTESAVVTLLNELIEQNRVIIKTMVAQTELLTDMTENMPLLAEIKDNISKVAGSFDVLINSGLITKDKKVQYDKISLDKTT